MSQRLRKIKSILVKQPDTDVNKRPRPELTWASPSALYVEENYQRDLSRSSIKLIKQIIDNWDWSKMKPPVVVDVDGKLCVIDGQHTATAAASLGLDSIPVMVVPGVVLKQRAKSFMAHNRDRLSVTRVQLHTAAVAAQDELAVVVEEACSKAGVTIRRSNTTSASFNVGDTTAVGVLYSLAARCGGERLRKVLKLLVLAKRAPLTATELRAASMVLALGHSPELLLLVVKQKTAWKWEAEATLAAKQKRIPIFKQVAAMWNEECKRLT